MTAGTKKICAFLSSFLKSVFLALSVEWAKLTQFTKQNFSTDKIILFLALSKVSILFLLYTKEAMCFVDSDKVFEFC